MDLMDRYANVEIDPITFRVLGGAFTSIAKEMGAILYRMAYSSLIRETEDLGAGILDPKGRLICESDSTPMHCGSMPFYIKGILKKLEGNIHEGDIIIHNDPYAGASHNPDVAIVVPVFHQGELIAFAADTAHWLDTGGAVPGLVIDVLDVYAEGKIFNALKLYDRGRLNQDLYDLIRDNIRVPGITMGDMEAQIASARVGAERFLHLVEKYGVDVVMGGAYQWMAYSEQMLRREIAKIPDGEYTEEGWLDDDGRHRGVPLKIKVTVRVKGDEIEIDYTGSSPQTVTAFNSPFEGSTCVGAYYIVRMLFLDEFLLETPIPQNEGMIRPVKVTAPKGTIYNPNFPAACTARFCPNNRAADLVIRALSPHLPTRATAGNSAVVGAVAYSGVRDDNSYWIYVEVNEGAYGGRATKDGLDAVDTLLVNARNNPIEELDWHYPVRNMRYELDDRLPAPGKWRGGIGVVRQNLFLTPAFLSSETERASGKDLPRGIFGGKNGHAGSLILNPGAEDEVVLPSKEEGRPVKAGDIFQFTSPSGAGYGDPFERSSELVLEDYLDGFVTLETAESEYGVAIDAASETIDQAKTSQLRASHTIAG